MTNDELLEGVAKTLWADKETPWAEAGKTAQKKYRKQAQAVIDYLTPIMKKQKTNYEQLRKDIWEDIFEGMSCRTNESVNAQAGRVLEKVMKHITGEIL